MKIFQRTTCTISRADFNNNFHPPFVKTRIIIKNVAVSVYSEFVVCTQSSVHKMYDLYKRENGQENRRRRRRRKYRNVKLQRNVVVEVI